jgi:catechol 2,3-dioxygenase-like lactoylglutathione lyase family enzyme
MHVSVETTMIGERAFSGYSTNDIAAAKAFYGDTLGLNVTEDEGMLTLKIGPQTVLIYPKDDHQPATYTCLNLEVADVDAAVDALREKGVEFERYDGSPQDERGVYREYGPPIAWFKDPAGNILSVIQTLEEGSPG